MPSNKKKRLALFNNGAFYCLVIILITFGVLSPQFLTLSNLLTVARQTSTVCVITICSFLAILTHQTDLSVGATASLTAVVAVHGAVNMGLPVWVACLLALLVGLAMGLLNGLLCGYTTIPPFIITLGTMYVGESIGIIITKGYTIPIADAAFTWIGAGTVFGMIPVPLILVVILVCIVSYVLRNRRYGTLLYAVGGNEDATLASGVNTRRIKLSVFVINGALATLAGFILASRLGSANPSQGMGLELDGICAAILGGTALSGGVGTITGAILGAITLQLLRNGLNLVGISSSVQMFLIGVAIVVILIFDSVCNMIAQRRRKRA